ncbi:mite allergen Der p 3-like [Convolutriloba macropyga]|uniref:mite allergen Der p 3-like n=1 Tax=Convolutriloba macropyga TaxID=536237 RepID=UPI003F524915
MNLSNNAARHPLKNNRIQFLLFIVVVSVLTEVETVFKCGIRPTERARERTSGSSNIKLVKRVVGGRQSKQGDWPWLVNLRMSLLDKDQLLPDDNLTPNCGSVLIHERYVLTASHCARRMKARDPTISGGQLVTTVHVGDYRSQERDLGEYVRYAKRIIMHERYYRPTEVHDIALIELDRPVKGAMPVCLATTGRREGERGTVLGWGSTSVRFGHGNKPFGNKRSTSTSDSDNEERMVDLPDKLREVDIPIVSGETCSHVMSLPSKESVFCGGDLFHGGKDACQGDSGGPMVQERNGRFEVIGVVSWGVGCGQPYKLGIYSNVSYHNSWIQSHIDEPFDI